MTKMITGPDIPARVFALGKGALATKEGATAVGNGAEAHGKDSVAIGHRVVVHEDMQVRIEVENWVTFFQEIRIALVKA